MNDSFDLIVIGAGSAARDGAAKASREFGARVALVERTRWGGSCPNVACRPTKAYLVAAELAFTVNELSGWMGVDCGPARVDLARVRAWKDSLRRPQESWLELLSKAYETVPGQASFVDARTVRVGGREVRVSHVLLASGRAPNTEELDLERVGVATDRGYVLVDDQQRTTVEGIWSAGDCAVGPQFTPAAQYQARIAIEDMFGTPNPRH